MFSFQNRICFFLISFMVTILGGCSFGRTIYITGLDSKVFDNLKSYSQPSLANRWLATLVTSNGRVVIELADLKNRKRIFLPGINTLDSEPISVSISANGDKLAFLRKRNDLVELILYRRRTGSLQRLRLNSNGVPSRVTVDGSGRVLAVQVFRNGKSEIDLIRL